MIYLITSCAHPIQYIDCGHIHSDGGFFHQRRMLDYHVFIYVTEGTLYMGTDGHEYVTGPQQFLILYAGLEHYGYRITKEKLSYFWVHFHLWEDCPFTCCDEHALSGFLNSRLASSPLNGLDCFILPEAGTVSDSGILLQLFSQMLNLSKIEPVYSSYLIHYSLNLLLMELTHEFLNHYLSAPGVPPHINYIKEWIRINYRKPVTVKYLASLFHYNPDYLSYTFKKYTGKNLIKFVHRTRIDAAKGLLSSGELSIKETAFACGYTDEKYFIRVFRQMEGMTPGEYRKTFYKCKVLAKKPVFKTN